TRENMRSSGRIQRRQSIALQHRERTLWVYRILILRIGWIGSFQGQRLFWLPHAGAPIEKCHRRGQIILSDRNRITTDSHRRSELVISRVAIRQFGFLNPRAVVERKNVNAWRAFLVNPVLEVSGRTYYKSLAV